MCHVDNLAAGRPVSEGLLIELMVLRGKDRMNSVLLVVFDGLRPDMVGPLTTPHLVRFAAMGTRFTAARSVFPTETRVCTASVTTGCQPRRHGLVANRFAHPGDLGRMVDTGSMAALRGLEDDLGTDLLAVPSLGDRLAKAGQDFAVFSSGSTGQAYVLNPRAAANGQMTLSAHGATACSPAGRALLTSVALPPTAPVPRAVWAADLFRTQILPNPPAASVLWLCEPDTSAHYYGLGSPAQMAALAAMDAAFGRILDDWQSGPQREILQIIVASDHGHTTVRGHIDVGSAMAAAPGFAGCTLVSGTSGGIWVPGGDRARVAGLAEFLSRQDWVGNLFANDGPACVLPLAAVLADHPRGAPLLFTLRGDAGTVANGLAGCTLYDGALELGAGTHGGLGAAELHTVLMLAGSKIAHGQSEWPAGLPDIAPTILHLLGIDAGPAMDGRVLAEALHGAAAPEVMPAVESWEAADAHYAQRLSRTRLGGQIYLDAGVRA